MIFPGYEGYGDDVVCVCKDRRTYDALRAVLPAKLKVWALTANAVDTSFEYVVYAEGPQTKTKLGRAKLEAFAAGVIAGVRYYR